MTKVHQAIVPLVFAGLLLVIASLQPAVAAPPAEAAAADGAQEPPLCTDKHLLKKLKTQYEALEVQRSHLTIKEIVDVKQSHFGRSPASVNQYATKTNYGTTSRSCEGTALLSDGKTDPIFWRMDYMVEGPRHSINLDYCSLKHDMTDAKCQNHRDGK